MSDFNNDQQNQTKEFFQQDQARRQELFQADQEREQQFFRDQAQQQDEMARQANQIRQEQNSQQLDRQAFQRAVNEWDRPDLQDLAQQKFEVGDKVEASFSTVTSQDDSLQFSKQGAAFESGQSEVSQVEIVATAQLTQQQFANAFDDYSNEPQPFLQGHSGLTQEGAQKAVAVSAPGQGTVVVVPNQQGQAQSFGFAPRPALVQHQAKVVDLRAEAPKQQAAEAHQGQVEQAKPDPLKPQRFTSNSWGSEGISDRWAKHESAQLDLQREIRLQKGKVAKTEEQVSELLKSREKFIEQTKGKTQDEIKKDPVLLVAQQKFEDQGKQLESAMKNLKEESAQLAKSQNQYAVNHAAFQADSWGRVKTGGEVMGSQETVRMASRKQEEFRAEVTSINAKQNANPLSKDAQKMAEQFEQQKQQQKSQQQQAPSEAKGSDLNQDTTAYMSSQHEKAREQGAKVVVMPDKNQHALSKLAQIQEKAKAVAEAMAKQKAEKEQKDQQQGKALSQ